jgi:hypothetical protein
MRAFCRFGFQFLRVLFSAWLLLLPNAVPLSQITHLLAMSSTPFEQVSITNSILAQAFADCKRKSLSG